MSSSFMIFYDNFRAERRRQKLMAGKIRAAAKAAKSNRFVSLVLNVF